MLSTYQSYLLYTSNPAATEQRTAAEPTVSRARTYYQANIGKVKSVDDFLGNYQLFSYAMKAYGLGDMTYGKAFMRKVLTSDLTDSHSFVNKLTDSRYKAFAQAFNFTTSGKVANTATAQTAAQTSDMASLYSTAASSATSSVEVSYMKTAVASLKSVSDLTGNARLLKDVMKAYGLTSSTDVGTITAALESDVSDPASVVNQPGQAAGLKQMVEDFNFDSTGAITTRRAAQTPSSMSAMAAAYKAQAGTSATAKAAATAETTYVEGVIGKATSVADIVNDPRVVKYIGKAFGIATLSATTLRSVLTSDVSDLKSAANKLGPSYANIAAAFEFTKTGTIARESANAVQSKAALAATNSGYLDDTIETEAGASNEGTRLALYFARKAPTIVNAYQILADPALLKVAQTILGLSSTSTTNIDLQAKQIGNGIKTADLTNPVKVNALVSRFAALYDLANPSTSQSDVSVLFGGSSSSSGSTSTTGTVASLLG